MSVYLLSIVLSFLVWFVFFLIIGESNNFLVNGIRIRKPIRGRNPNSGEAIELSERKVPYFRASKKLNQKLN